jgi:hypothetical protein
MEAPTVGEAALPAMRSNASPGSEPATPAAAEVSIDERLRQLLSGRRVLVGNPSPAYAAMLRNSLLVRDGALSPPAMLGICATAALLRQQLPDDSGDLLLVTTGHLQDGCCVPLVEELLRRPDPPGLVVVLGVEEAALPLAPLLDERTAVQLVWEGHIGEGILVQALEHQERGERFVDPEARRRIEAELAIAGSLTARERQVLMLVAEGLTNRQIAERIVVAEVTARDHVQRILRKLAVPDRTAAAVLALRLGLLD